MCWLAAASARLVSRSSSKRRAFSIAIKAWSAKVKAWHDGGEPADGRRIAGESKPAKKGRDVYVFFDNTDVKLRAPVDARRIAGELGIADEKTPKKVLDELGVKPKTPKRPKD